LANEPREGSIRIQVATIGMDLAKYVFQATASEATAELSSQVNCACKRAIDFLGKIPS